jgi:uncharacterized protein
MRVASVAALVLALSFQARAASFDCSKATTAVEKMICADAQLSDLDVQVARSYRRALENPADAGPLKSEQRLWLADRNKCKDVACLASSYQQRLKGLDSAPTAPPSKPTAAPSKEPSFTEAPFISPRIINDLSPWESDHGDHVIAINITDAQGSNRYFGDVQTRKTPGKNPYVFVVTPGQDAGDRGSEFGYSYVGKTASGIDVLMTVESGGGSGSFEKLLLVRLERDSTGSDLKRTSGNIEALTFKKQRVLIRKLGDIELGDRWAGDLKITGNQILIGKDRGALSRAAPSGSRVITIDDKP